MNWRDKPRLNKAVHKVAVETFWRSARVSDFINKVLIFRVCTCVNAKNSN